MLERRYFSIDDLELRAEKDEQSGKRKIVGYYAVKNSNSRKMAEYINGQYQEFTERILPTAFDNADLSNVIHTVEHNINRVVGRTDANLKLTVDERGLYAETKIPAVNEASHEQETLVRNIQQNIIRGCSFAFRVKEDRWYKKGNELFRDIISIARVADITSTVSPAYPDTDVLVKRSLDESLIVIEERNIIDDETIDLNTQIALLQQF